MKKIGFIDYYLDEWHANNYPKWIRERANVLGLDWDVAYAWAEMDKADGLTTEQWCEKQQVQRVASIEQLVALSDAIIVLSPDYPEHHARLSELALRSGKPVYMDKTFAPDAETAKDMFSLAEKYRTPLFSSSALRFALEIQAYKAKNLDVMDSVSTLGPGHYDNYAVHQFEVIVTLLGTSIKRVKGFSTEHTRKLIIEYHNGQLATFEQTINAPFQAFITDGTGETTHVQQFSEMFNKLIEQVLIFFDTSEIPVQPSETIAIIKLIEAGKAAFAQNDTWITF